MNVEREVRFAVVMYGGVSLAIYINGVAQELLNMVRATAPKTAGGNEALINPNDDELSGSAGVYRKLGQYLEHDRKRLEWIDKPPTATAGKTSLDRVAGEQSDDPIFTRFVVDVISGTSAGGINGVFLAKALARNQKMDGLKKLWLKEGDLSKLLNDSESVADLSQYGLSVEEPQRSLLNSQRMYRKLLEALEQMAEDKPDSNEDSPLVGELDLFITTTDIEGIPLPIILADDVIYERRYRNVHHFRYAPIPRKTKAPNDPEEATPPASTSQARSRDDFKKEDDPFLAFAARCTSSFPFAFDAMCLRDIEAVMKRYPRYKGDDPDNLSDDPKRQTRWDHFFSDYLRLGLFDLDKKARKRKVTGLPPDARDKIKGATDTLRSAFRDRAFGDGGYLDNKPFSYATSMLMRRYSNCVVDRKLLYIEPTPEHPELIPDNPKRPDFAENVRRAVLDLPRQETIREDIERLYDRNEMLGRTGTFAKSVDTDVTLINEKKPPLSHDDFGAADLRDMINLYGVSYGAYHRLKVEEIIDLLGDLITRALGYDPDSDAAEAIREIVAAWRNENYREIKQDGKHTENLFLLEFDIRYCLRRLMFLSRRVNQLAEVEKPGEPSVHAQGLLRAWLKHLIDSRESETDKAPLPPVMKNVDLKKAKRLGKWLGLSFKDSELADGPDKFPSDWVNHFREALNDIKRRLGNATIDARLAEETFLDPESGAAGKLRHTVGNLKLPWLDLEPVLSDNDEVKKGALKTIFQKNPPDTWESIARVFRDTLSDRSFASVKIFESSDVDPIDPAAAARLCLDHYCRNFVLYDLVTYPVQYGTGAGEANVVEVFRISPEDATALIHERKTNRQKLAGRTLMSFGAFLDQRWRKNDMLWGRLDGAERLITALLPGAADAAVREDLIKEAHMAILREEVKEEDLISICRLLSDALAHCDASSEQGRKLRMFVDNLLAGKEFPFAMNAALRQCLEKPEDIWRYYKDHFEVNRQLDPEDALRLISRTTTITGKMLEGLAQGYRSVPGKRIAAWITRLGATFWNMIAVAVPQSFGNLFFRHWLGLLYLFAFLTILVGVFINERVKIAGWEALGIVIALHVLVAGLGSYISGRKTFGRAIFIGIVLSLLTLIVLGGAYIAEHFPKLSKPAERNLLVIVAVALLLAVGLPQFVKRIWKWIKSKRQKSMGAPSSSAPANPAPEGP
jgi:patatin-related protein